MYKKRGVVARKGERSLQKGDRKPIDLSLLYRFYSC